jgi:putative ABC transport system ATP-binding protein
MADDARGFCFEEVSVVVGNGTAILDRVDAAIPGHGLTVIAGPSGSGKSTLLRLCNRLEVPTSGRIRLDGDDLATIDPLVLRRRAGMVFQRPVVFGGTVRDNLQVARADAQDEVCAGALARAGLGPELLERQADDLSGGEAQRMCIARTLLTDPQILLMDEATSALDVDARLVIEKLALDLVASGLTVLWVTHDLEQAERLADHTLVILEGRVADPLDAQRFLAARSFVVDGAVASREPVASPDAFPPAAEIEPAAIPPTAEGPYEDAV